jgi:hypothetical protein
MSSNSNKIEEVICGSRQGWWMCIPQEHGIVWTYIYVM